MTIREELEKLGPKRVRRAMVAFEHRGDLAYHEADGTCPRRLSGRAPCCFLHHAFGHGWTGADWMLGAIERAFEGWRRDSYPMTKRNRIAARRRLRAECIAFLAEHGDAKEIAPVREVLSGSAVVQQEATP